MGNRYFDCVLKRYAAENELKKMESAAGMLGKLKKLAGSSRSCLDSFSGIDAGIAGLIDAGDYEKAQVQLVNLPAMLDPLEKALSNLRGTVIRSTVLDNERNDLLDFCKKRMGYGEITVGAERCRTLISRIVNDNKAYVTRCRTTLASSPVLRYFRGVLAELLSVVDGGDPDGALKRAAGLSAGLDAFKTKLERLDGEPVWDASISGSVDSFIKDCRNSMRSADLSKCDRQCDAFFDAISASTDAKTREELAALDAIAILNVFTGVKRDLQGLAGRHDFRLLHDSLRTAVPGLEGLKKSLAGLGSVKTFSNAQKTRVSNFRKQCKDSMTLSEIGSMTAGCAALEETLRREVEAQKASLMGMLSSSAVLRSFKGVYDALTNAVRSLDKGLTAAYIRDVEAKLTVLRQRLSSMVCPSWVPDGLRKKATAHIGYCDSNMTISGIDGAQKQADDLISEIKKAETVLREGYMRNINADTLVCGYQKLKEEMLFFARTRSLENLRNELDSSRQWVIKLNDGLQSLSSAMSVGGTGEIAALKNEASAFISRCRSSQGFSDIQAAIRKAEQLKATILYEKGKEQERIERERLRREAEEKRRRKFIILSVGCLFLLGLGSFVMVKICGSWMGGFWKVLLGIIDVLVTLVLCTGITLVTIDD